MSATRGPGPPPRAGRAVACRWTPDVRGRGVPRPCPGSGGTASGEPGRTRLPGGALSSSVRGDDRIGGVDAGGRRHAHGPARGPGAPRGLRLRDRGHRPGRGARTRRGAGARRGTSARARRGERARRGAALPRARTGRRGLEVARRTAGTRAGGVPRGHRRMCRPGARRQPRRPRPPARERAPARHGAPRARRGDRDLRRTAAAGQARRPGGHGVPPPARRAGGVPPGRLPGPAGGRGHRAGDVRAVGAAGRPAPGPAAAARGPAAPCVPPLRRGRAGVPRAPRAGAPRDPGGAAGVAPPAREHRAAGGAGDRVLAGRDPAGRRQLRLPRRRPAEPRDQPTRHRLRDLPAAVVPDRLLRHELRLHEHPHGEREGLPGARPRPAAVRPGRGHVLRAVPHALAPAPGRRAGRHRRPPAPPGCCRPGAAPTAKGPRAPTPTAASSPGPPPPYGRRP
ncbi:hypothetical protein SLAVM298S_05509 [Streptomyces lavendulae subsp. lavendulae]